MLNSAVMRRDEVDVEAELVEIMGLQDDTLKLERIVAWCAAYPDEIPFALRFFRDRLVARNADSKSAT